MGINLKENQLIWKSIVFVLANISIIIIISIIILPSIIQKHPELFQNVLIYVLIYGIIGSYVFISSFLVIMYIFNKKKYMGNWGVGNDQASVLRELENRIRRRIPIVHHIFSGTVGAEVRDGEVIGLGLYNCSLSKLPSIFGQLKSLKKLNLGANSLKTLPRSFKQLKMLQKLNLYSNKLELVPDFINDLQSLKMLKLDYNNLKTLPEKIVDHPTLKHIRVVGNPWNKVQVKEIWKKLRKKGVKVHKFIF